MPRAKMDVFDLRLVELALFAKALSHPVRIRILQMLAADGEMASMKVVEALPLSQPACSRHIRELLKAGLLRERVRGSHVYYRLQATALQKFCNGMHRELHPERTQKM